jgi:hypothetical protein
MKRRLLPSIIISRIGIAHLNINNPLIYAWPVMKGRIFTNGLMQASRSSSIRRRITGRIPNEILYTPLPFHPS